MRKLVWTAAVLFAMGSVVFGQKQHSQVAIIKTSAECAVCKKKIETLLSSEKGIKRSTVDLNAKTVDVTYDPQKISLVKIRSVLSEAGYDADSIPANNKALQRVKESHK